MPTAVGSTPCPNKYSQRLPTAVKDQSVVLPTCPTKIEDWFPVLVAPPHVDQSMKVVAFGVPYIMRIASSTICTASVGLMFAFTPPSGTEIGMFSTDKF